MPIFENETIPISGISFLFLFGAGIIQKNARCVNIIVSPSSFYRLNCANKSRNSASYPAFVKKLPANLRKLKNQALYFAKGACGDEK
jgi:hypothetical protein